VGKVNN